MIHKVGNRYGNLTLVDRYFTPNGYKFVVQCDCGVQTTKTMGGVIRSPYPYCSVKCPDYPPRVKKPKPEKPTVKKPLPVHEDKAFDVTPHLDLLAAFEYAVLTDIEYTIATAEDAQRMRNREGIYQWSNDEQCELCHNKKQNSRLCPRHTQEYDL